MPLFQSEHKTSIVQQHRPLHRRTVKRCHFRSWRLAVEEHLKIEESSQKLIGTFKLQTWSLLSFTMQVWQHNCSEWHFKAYQRAILWHYLLYNKHTELCKHVHNVCRDLSWQWVIICSGSLGCRTKQQVQLQTKELTWLDLFKCHPECKSCTESQQLSHDTTALLSIWSSPDMGN